MAEGRITAEMVLHAYTVGAFPMASERQGAVQWYTADPRAIIPLDAGFIVRRSLAKIIARGDFVVTRDRAFKQVIAACAEPRAGAEETWINSDIIRIYCELADRGYAHSIEAWVPDEDGSGMTLVGGLYGIAIGAVFFGESMFTRKPYASQVCLCHLVEHLRAHDYLLLDVQFTNPHLEQFGVMEIAANDYMQQLQQAIEQPMRW